MSILYAAVERFDPSCAEAWSKYIAWSGLRHLREVISLDGVLCPSMFRDLTAVDWQELVHIELEMSWKSGSAEARSRVEHYLTRFPRLQQPAIILRLVEQEYRVRRRFGETSEPARRHGGGGGRCRSLRVSWRSSLALMASPLEYPKRTTKTRIRAIRG